jgi:hypothetical protein
MNRKILKILLVAFVCLISAKQVRAWNCVDAHPAINRFAGRLFIVRSQSECYGDKYSRAIVDFKMTFSGYTFKKAKMSESSSGKYLHKTNFVGWLARGGHDADVPSFEMGFRHFYDPYYEPSYLTWFRRWFKKPKKSSFSSEAEFFKSLQYKADDWNINKALGDKIRNLKWQPRVIRPKIDAITWALSHPENEHSWLQGLKIYKAAMENDSDKLDGLSREKAFSKAFRCLGETMHLMADMAEPAHVRADSHSVQEPIEQSVNGKMIEKIIGDTWKNKKFKPTGDFSDSENLSPADRMVNLARFTNENFFSNDTIFDYKSWIFPRNHKRPYPKPQLSGLKKVKDVYFKHFADVGWVPMAKETGSLFSSPIIKIKKLKSRELNVLKSMAEGQAKVLIPLAVYNCARLPDLFFPTLKMKADIDHHDGNTYLINAEISHHIENDPEWEKLGQIKYSGLGYLVVNGAYRQTCEFVKGRLVDFKANFDSGSEIEVCVRAGGRLIWSEKLEAR